MTIAALDPADERSLQARVAGPAALFVAKAHKLHDRVASRRASPPRGQGRRRCRATHADHETERGRRHVRGPRQDAIAGIPSTNALTYIEELLGRRGSLGIEMAARALQVAMPEEDRVAYVAALLARSGTRHKNAR